MNPGVKIFLALLLVAGAAFFVLELTSTEVSLENPTRANIIIPSQVKLYAVGDIMLDRGVEYMINRFGDGDFRFPFFKIKEKLREADILFGNLESVISDKGEKVGSIYSFRADIQALEGLKYAGFNVLSLANNHMFDYQRVALEDAMLRLEEQGIEYIGAGFNAKEAFSVKIKEVKGVKIGFLAYTNLGPVFWRAKLENGTGLAWIDRNSFSYLKENIKEAKEKVDVLVVSLHAGVEYALEPTQFQEDFAHLCIEQGADLVLVHHPHVVQRIEKYKQAWIAYSLGNFVFDQGFSEKTMESIILKVIIENKKIKQVVAEKVKLNPFFQPE